MKKYNSKILLFGEHTINKGSQALAAPLFHFFGKWEKTELDVELPPRQGLTSSQALTSTQALTSKQMNLPSFANYLKNLKDKNELLCNLDVNRFQKELSEGLFFNSNIPTGYGVGSSGALCAAVYDLFCSNQLEKQEGNFFPLKKIFAQLESFFHGESSGTDPLICFLEKTILLESKTNIRTVDFSKTDGYQLFLLDTKIPRQTGPFVNLFLKKCEDKNYFDRIESELNPMVDEAIAAFISQNVNVLLEKFHEIGFFQFKYFAEMIPEDFRAVWLDGLASNFFKLKLCGAGGGGFILGMTTDFEKTKKHLKGYSVFPVL